MNKILVITTAHDEDYQFEQWCRFYEEFKNEIAYHVIVDNGSKSGYKEKVKAYFTDSYIIELEKDLGITGGFNAGIKYALTTDCTHIYFLIQDMRMPTGSITALCNTLEEHKDFGVICPIIFFENNSNIIREYGGEINDDISIKKHYTGVEFTNDIPEFIEIGFACGGAYMVRKDFFDIVGLYDEKIFLYGDEADLFYRAKLKGIKIASTTRSKCWHEHIWKDGSEKGRRFPSNEALFYSARNYFYLIRKHGNSSKLIKGIFNQVSKLPRFTYRYLIRDFYYKKFSTHLKGLATGLFYK